MKNLNRMGAKSESELYIIELCQCSRSLISVTVLRLCFRKYTVTYLKIERSLVPATDSLDDTKHDSSSKHKAELSYDATMPLQGAYPQLKAGS